MIPVTPILVQEAIDELRADRRVERIEVERTAIWSWDRAKNGDGQEYRAQAWLTIKPNITDHRPGGRGIPAAESVLVARLGIENSLIHEVELQHSAPYGLVRLVESALKVGDL